MANGGAGARKATIGVAYFPPITIAPMTGLIGSRAARSHESMFAAHIIMAKKQLVPLSPEGLARLIAMKAIWKKDVDAAVAYHPLVVIW